MDKLQERLQTNFQNELEKIDKEFLRRLQAYTFTCSLRCVKNTTASTKDVQKCLAECNEPTEEAQNVIQDHVSELQSSLQRCVADCGYKIRQRIPDNISEAESKQYRVEAESCATRCLETHLKEQMPDIVGRLRTEMQKLKVPESS